MLFNFKKENIDTYLFELSKSLKRKIGRDKKIEIIIVGGGSILINYDFRSGSNDIDAFYEYDITKEAINEVADKYNLPNDWLNNDFIKTKSYSPKIVQYSLFYKTFSNILEVRTISKEYLLAMKLMSFRQYKNDLSDIVSIINEERKRNNFIDFKKINQAVINLYDDWSKFPTGAKEFIEKVLLIDDLNPYLAEIQKLESNNKKTVIEKIENKANKDEIYNSLDKIIK